MKTALYEQHKQLNAKMVDFSGWQMPVQYKGIIPEHIAVRTKVGLFDVSHMGRISISGKDAEAFLDYISTNTIKSIPNYSATYTVWPMEKEGCVDDVIVYLQDQEHFFVIVNAGNRQKDLDHLQTEAKRFPHVHIQEHFEEEGILALQGPNAEALITPLFLEAATLPSMHFASVSYHGQKIILSRTGYTGSGGFEIYAPNSLIVELWDYFMNEGGPFGLEPAGLGARDTLRLEMGYALYGHEISDSVAANESVSRWTINWDKEFIGKKFMQDLEQSGQKRYEYGVILLDPGVAREGYAVYKDGACIGKVSSGNYAPSLDKAVAIILVEQALQKKDVVEIQIRQNRVKAHVVSLPFFVKPATNDGGK